MYKVKPITKKIKRSIKDYIANYNNFPEQWPQGFSVMRMSGMTIKCGSEAEANIAIRILEYWGCDWDYRDHEDGLSCVEIKILGYWKWCK
tara:strand:+ start:99 stop:368 length:270 start_codon:yes stop_codon:yes gene_type:complete